MSCRCCVESTLAALETPIQRPDPPLHQLKRRGLPMVQFGTPTVMVSLNQPTTPPLQEAIQYICLSRHRPLVRMILIHKNRHYCQLVPNRRVRAVFRSSWCGRTNYNTRSSGKISMVAMLLHLFLSQTNKDPKQVMMCWESATPRIDWKTMMVMVVVTKYLLPHQHHLPVPMTRWDPLWMNATTITAVMSMTTTTIIITATLPTTTTATMELSQALHVQHQQQSTTAAPLWSCPSHRQMDAPNLQRTCRSREIIRQQSQPHRQFFLSRLPSFLQGTTATAQTQQLWHGTTILFFW